MNAEVFELPDAYCDKLEKWETELVERFYDFDEYVAKYFEGLDLPNSDKSPSYERPPVTVDVTTQHHQDPDQSLFPERPSSCADDR